MKYLETDKRKWLFAFGLSSFLILAVTLLSNCLLNSSDDVFLMYTLAGGFGEAPTAMLHYNYGWHPVLGWIIKSLFQAAPGFNWYSFFLLLLHLFGLSSILYVLLKRLSFYVSMGMFLLLFIFTEARLLQSLNYSGTAAIAALGAMSLLVNSLKGKSGWQVEKVFAIAILMVGGMLRLHIVFLCIMLFIPTALTILKRKQLFRLAAILASVCILLFALNKIQVSVYKKNIPGWEKQERLRQALFYAYNRTLKTNMEAGVFADSSEMQSFFSGFINDSSTFSAARLKKIGKSITRARLFNDHNDNQALYWLFMELRPYILLITLLIIPLFIQKNYRSLKSFVISGILVLMIYAALFIFLKTTLTLHFTLLTALLVALYFQLDKEYPAFKNKIYGYAWTFTVLLATFWILSREKRQAHENKINHGSFVCAVEEINKNKERLFITTDDSFPIGYFKIQDSPANYPITNLVFKERLLANEYIKTLQRFEIKNLQTALYTDSSTLIIGMPLRSQLSSRKTFAPDSTFSCLRVYH